MHEQDAIEFYNRAGERGAPRGVAPVRWPDLVLTPENVASLVEGVLAARVDLGGAAFGPDFDGAAAAAAGALEIAWRTDAWQLRYAPEGVFARAVMTARIRLAPAETDETGAAEGRGGGDDEPGAEELVRIAIELCVSFVTRRHVRPFVDVMSGRWERLGDGAGAVIDPFALEIDPRTAIEWGLNGAEP